METVQDTIERIRKQSNNNILSELENIAWGDTPEATIAAIQSAPVQQAIMEQANSGSLVGNTLGAFGIGAVWDALLRLFHLSAGGITIPLLTSLISV